MTTVSMLLGDVTSGYPVKNSLRFRSSASAYLNRTPATATNQKTWTLSFWVKRGVLSTANKPFAWGTAGTEMGFQFRADNTIEFYQYASSAYVWVLDITAVYRDPSAWYHIVLSVDTTQATSTNRLAIYVNGSQVTSFTTATYPSLNLNTFANSPSYVAMIGNLTGQSQYFDGYMAEVNFIDGQALAASSFGTYDTNGVWQPIKYSGSFGTNGFYLNFGNTTSTTTLGYDTSGNSNNWTVNNVSLTAGSTYDSMTDSPTVSSASVANYPVLNPLAWRTAYSNTVPTNGNLTCTGIDNFHYFTATMASSGLYYFEMTATTVAGSGAYVAIWQSENPQSGAVTACDYYSSTGVVTVLGTTVFTGATYTSGDIIGFAHNTLAGTVAVYKNGTLQGTATGLPATIKLYPGCLTGAGTVFNANFGQRPFAYTPPTGFNALNTYNLPAPTIANGAQYMAATTYAGNSSTNNVLNSNNTTTSVSFKPDFVWLKNRTSALAHYLSNTITGPYQILFSNLTNAEYNGTSFSDGVSTFNTNGFTLLNGSNVGNYNQTANNYVAWQWLAGAGSSSSNTNGSITSTVSANTTAGFSIVTYTGTGASNPTIGHGLGVTPNMIILKDRNTNSQNPNWQVYHSSLTSGYFLSLNTTDAQAAISGTSYGSVGQPTSTTFKGVAGSVDSTTTNQNTQLYVAYCWSAVSGYSAFGSYTGNGSTDGPFVYTGFRPRYILLKNSTTAGGASWWIYDTSRSTYNVDTITLYANSSNAENNGAIYNLDILSNGFKVRTTDDINLSGATIVYAAFAENPFNSSRAR